MSAEPVKQKRKDKKKKKAMLEALQQEEYFEERAHVRLDGPLEDDEENFVVHSTDDSDEGMPLLEESDGSGACAKIIFLVLLSSLGLAVGVIIFELGGIESIKGFTGFGDMEQAINVPIPHAQPESPVVPLAVDEEFLDEIIEPSLLQTDTFKEIEIDVQQESVQEVEENILHEEVPETIITEQSEEAVTEPVVEVTEHVENEETEENLPEPVVETVVDTTENLPELVEEETETISEVVEETRPLEVSENFETQLEDDPVEVPQESFTMRAEREAVQEAVDNVWVMTVRCIEELRALQVMAKAPLTQTIIDNISQRLEPLRTQLDDLVKNTSDSVFDGALEKAAELERNLRTVLNELDEARIQDTVLVEEAARQEEEEAARVKKEEEAARVKEEEEAARVKEEEEAARVKEELAAQAAQIVSEEVEVEAESENLAEEVVPSDEQYSEEGNSEVEVAYESEAELNEEAILKTTESATLEATESEVVQEFLSAFSEDQVIEFDVQADEPIAQSEEPVEAVSNEDAAQVLLEQEVIQLVEEQIIDEAPEMISEPESMPVSEPLEEPNLELNEVEEPVQVAAEAFVVEQQEERTPEQNTELPSRAQNLEEADRLVDQSPAQALALMEQILEKDPVNALGLYGRARSLDSLAEVEKSNARLEQSIFAYRAVLDLEEQVDDELYLKAALRCIDRMRFRGFHGKSIRIQQRLVARFPNEIEYQNQLAIGFLLTNQPEAARTVFESVLERWPHSGFAQVHLGFILKTTYDDYHTGASLMMAGIATREEGVIDGRFYTHLGDALSRLGKHQEAQQVYAEGEKESVFLSREQRSLYNVDRLTGRPWWDKEATTYGPFLDLLEANWIQIRDEGVKLLSLTAPEGFVDEAEKLKNTGDWKQFELFAQGRKNVAHCNKAPVTCALIENYPPALCKRGQVKFSIMHPGTHVFPHTGPTNCRIRSHLGLVVPGGAELRVGNTTKSWEEGKFIIFDDSFDHEVWHKGPSYRLVLIVDFWHPELTVDEWRSLASI